MTFSHNGFCRLKHRNAFDSPTWLSRVSAVLLLRVGRGRSCWALVDTGVSGNPKKRRWTVRLVAHYTWSRARYGWLLLRYTWSHIAAVCGYMVDTECVVWFLFNGDRDIWTSSLCVWRVNRCLISYRRATAAVSVFLLFIFWRRLFIHLNGSSHVS